MFITFSGNVKLTMLVLSESFEPTNETYMILNYKFTKNIKISKT